jgi:hypothetical protein
MLDGWPTATLTALRRGQLMVGEVEASQPRHRAWVAVYPIQGTGAFNVFRREFDQEYIDNDWCVGPDDGMVENEAVRVANEDQLTEVLGRLHVRLQDLKHVHNSDYPV